MTYAWARRGDVNAFFGLMLDNVAVMIILVTTLAASGFTAGFVLSHMIPGTALGVLLGDLVFTWMAFRLARRTGRTDVTAMPLGLDTPSTFGVAFLVLIPALTYGDSKFGKDHHDQAMQFAWHVGLVALILCGIFKTLLAPLGNAVRRLVPRAGLLGSLAAIALALIAFLPLVLDGIAGVPLVGLVALIIILVTLVAHRELPGRFPGALAAVLIGMAVYWLCVLCDSKMGSTLVPSPQKPEPFAMWDPASLLSFYSSDSTWWREVFEFALGRLPVVLPFALATVVGGIDCTESAAAAGDDYDTRAILFTEGLASLAAGLLGGVIQTTPYIGHPAYKKMDGRAAYTLATALFVGMVGCVGGFSYLYYLLPKAAMFPILVFVGLEITAQSFHATPTRHYPALALAILPTLAYLIMVPLKQVLFLVPEVPVGQLMVMLQTLRCLANGFLLSSLLWAAALAMIIDHRLRTAAAFFAVAAVLAFFGFIHSPLLDEQVGLPWQIMKDPALANFLPALTYQTPYHWTAAYGMVAVLLLALDLLGRKSATSADQAEATPAEKKADVGDAPLPSV